MTVVWETRGKEGAARKAGEGGAGERAKPIVVEYVSSIFDITKGPDAHVVAVVFARLVTDTRSNVNLANRT